ncbi:YigZ family protein [Corynebacterium sp. HS2168-gen11]|uniref:YigZ family protein n=1 Tax=Corynebacterium sp. HS2168-gen11 TaxID=2974027 RepID=UPI00216ABC8A|nr:YigZ family protein [Corynebacterium sp. HS2168-gen11]MCS4536225.1 YigZ family protein [Corynebacterium sp. HS2168-gen11]
MYNRPVADIEFFNEIDIKRSKFLTFITRVENEEQARAFIGSLKSRYPDARHHCSAYIYHVEGANPVERSSDDGEPSGTAGTPMLDVLRGSGLLDIAAVTVRYFGGIKLGAGGLVHAYSDSVSQCLTLVKSVTRAEKELYSVSLQHGDAGRIEAELRGRGYQIVDVSYSNRVTLTIGIDPGTYEQLAGTLAALTAGGARVLAAGTQWVE